MRVRAATILVACLPLGCGRGNVFFDDFASDNTAGRPNGSASSGSGGSNGTAGGNGSTTGSVTGLPSGCSAPNRGVPSNTGCQCCPAWTKCDTDPLAGIGCQLRCNTSADCPQLGTACNGSTCLTNVCGPGTTNGTTYGASCNAGSTNDGTCFAMTVTDELNSKATIGVCFQGGTTNGSCQSSATRCDLQTACVVERICSSGSCSAY